MNYLLAIYHDETTAPRPGDDGWDEMLAAYGALTAQLDAAGKLVASGPLQGTMTATTLRIRDHERLVTDGPFAETGEQFAGFFLVEADDLDEAIGYAAAIPTVEWGSVEVRPMAD